MEEAICHRWIEWAGRPIKTPKSGTKAGNSQRAHRGDRTVASTVSTLWEREDSAITEGKNFHKQCGQSDQPIQHVLS